MSGAFQRGGRTAAAVRAALAAASAAVLAAGCFDEPRPAYETVRPETQVYMKDGDAAEFTPAVLLERGKVFLQDGGWTNLSALVSEVEPASFTYLNLDRNALTNVDALASFTSLRWLRLDGNRLESLPDLSGLSGLKRIYLRDNAFREVPEGIRSIDSLTDIDLSGNPVKSVPAWLAAKKGLENLSLSRTAIRELPEDLSAWRSLQTLQLGDLDGMPDAERRRIRAELPGTAVVF